MTEQYNKSIGVSSCICGDFNSNNADKNQENKWSFCFNKSDMIVSLKVSIISEALNSQELISNLTPDDIKQLVHWLCQAKNGMKQTPTAQ